MFAHQVIEDLGKSKIYYSELAKKIPLPVLKNAIKNRDSEFVNSFLSALLLSWNAKILADRIKNAQKFHLSLQTNSNYIPVAPKTEPLFSSPPSSEVRPPYKLSFYDWSVDYSDSSEPERCMYGERELAPESRKRAILCYQLHDYIISVFIFNYFGFKKMWDMAPIGQIIPIGKSFSELNDSELMAIENEYKTINPMLVNAPDLFNDFRQKLIVGEQKGASIPIKLASMDEPMTTHYLQENGDEIKILATILTLLSCKNIGAETVPAPIKLNNKRKKQNKQPIFSYKTLVIKPVGKHQESIPKHLWENRIHLQRGHFKTYTAEKPLFGRITGRFWWQPHVRGQNKDGVVMKDYKVEA
jgi:hypothetical protein